MNQGTKALLVVVALLLSFAISVYGLGNALGPLLISFGAAYLVFPLIRKMEAKGVARHHAVIGVFGLFLFAFVGALVLIIPAVVSDANAFLKELPHAAAKASQRIEMLASDFGYDLDLSVDELRRQLHENTSTMSGGLIQGLSRGVFAAFSGATDWLISILSFFLIPLFFFYVINDFEKISMEIKSFIPQPMRPKLRHYLDLSNRVLSGYIRGQLMVAVVLATLYGIGLSAIGLKFGVLIGLVTGLLSIIPYAGFTIGLSAAVLVGLANDGGAAMLIGIAIVFGIIQGLEGTVITPRLVGNKVGLSPLATMLALIIGGNLGGLAGMVVAIPAAAIAKSILSELKAEYQELEFYKS